MLINCTNHPSARWDARQRRAAEAYGETVDFPFPAIDPELSEEALAEQAAGLVRQILSLQPDAVLCQGEMGMTYCLTEALLRSGVTVLHACAKRECSERLLADGTTEKTARFAFCGFRRYQPLPSGLPLRA